MQKNKLFRTARY